MADEAKREKEIVSSVRYLWDNMPIYSRPVWSDMAAYIRSVADEQRQALHLQTEYDGYSQQAMGADSYDG